MLNHEVNDIGGLEANDEGNGCEYTAGNRSRPRQNRQVKLARQSPDSVSVEGLCAGNDGADVNKEVFAWA